MTHCLLFCLLVGGVAAGTSLLSPWVVLGWLAFGVRAAASAIGDWMLLAGAGTAAVPMLLDDTGPLSVLAGMQGWIGVAAGIGCLVHILGDMCTVSGVPILWPMPIGGETWAELHLLPRGFRLHTGHRTEQWLVFPGFVIATAATALIIPGMWPQLTDLLHHVQ